MDIQSTGLRRIAVARKHITVERDGKYVEVEPGSLCPELADTPQTRALEKSGFLAFEFVRDLPPLADVHTKYSIQNMDVKHLRNIARAWDINVSGAKNKREIAEVIIESL